MFTYPSRTLSGAKALNWKTRQDVLRLLSWNAGDISLASPIFPPLCDFICSTSSISTTQTRDLRLGHFFYTNRQPYRTQNDYSNRSVPVCTPIFGTPLAHITLISVLKVDRLIV